RPRHLTARRSVEIRDRVRPLPAPQRGELGTDDIEVEHGSLRKGTGGRQVDPRYHRRTVANTRAHEPYRANGFFKMSMVREGEAPAEPQPRVRPPLAPRLRRSVETMKDASVSQNEGV